MPRTKAPSTELTKLLTPAKLAEHLEVSTGTLANWRSAGTGPKYVRLAGVVRYRVDAVEKWIAAGDPPQWL